MMLESELHQGYPQDKVLTLQILKDLRPGTIFAVGVTTYSPIYRGEIRWIAKRGNIHDWTIYYHHSDHSVDFIERHGDKVYTDENIRHLVPCDDEALAMYRK